VYELCVRRRPYPYFAHPLGHVVRTHTVCVRITILDVSPAAAARARFSTTTTETDDAPRSSRTLSTRARGRASGPARRRHASSVVSVARIRRSVVRAVRFAPTIRCASPS